MIESAKRLSGEPGETSDGTIAGANKTSGEQMSEHKPERTTLRQALLTLCNAGLELGESEDKTLSLRSKIAEASRQIRWALKTSRQWCTDARFQFVCDGVVYQVNATDNDYWPTVTVIELPVIDGSTSAMPFDENEGEG